jgi:GNAT superfamily N-acetyltransferase
VALWRVHVELEDRPGRLGELATAVGATGCNIISVHVVGEPTDAGSITDELLVRVPEGIDPSVLIIAATRIGAPCTLHVRADATELADPVTTALALARMVAADPGSAPRAVATMLHARLVDPAAAPAADLHTHPLRIGAQHLLLGRGWPFTATELSRAAALLELAAQLALSAPSAGTELGFDRVLLLRDGSEVLLRDASPSDAPLVAALHARCSPESRRARFLSPTPRLDAGQLRELVDPEGGRAVLALTADGGSAIGVADLRLEQRADPGSASFGVLVEDAWQHRGLGTALVRRIAETAVEHGVCELTGTVPVDSVLTEQPPPGDVGSSDVIQGRITRLLRRAGLHPTTVRADGTLQLNVPLETAAAMA